MWCRPQALVAIAASLWARTSFTAASDSLDSGLVHGSTANGERLAVVVPVHEGDISRALSSLERWPSACSSITLSNVDLVLYKAEAPDGTSGSILSALRRAAGGCFAHTKVVYGDLGDEDNVYPRGPSVQFYKLFLDEGVRQNFVEYDALAIIEWDVMVAHDSSFEELYHATFGGNDQFWVKGSVLEGTNFHETAQITDMWHILGHINGNAIYNNTDPDFVEFVKYTLTRWEYKYPYDVALWATIADFPYSWPLWQRYSSKFITTNLIANVGYNNVDATALTTAVAGDTLFIHGSSVEGGSRSIHAGRQLGAVVGSAVSCTSACGTHADELPPGMSTVCDASCDEGNRFGGYLCGAGDPDKYGESCRECYTDQQAALVAEKALRHVDSPDTDTKHVIMCNTKRPPSSMDCSSKCALKTDTVCDHTCGTGRHGDYNCNWRDRGLSCRYCFSDLETALVADEVAKRRGGRVIMCDTHEPPRVEVPADSDAVAERTSRRLGSRDGKDEDESRGKSRDGRKHKSTNKSDRKNRKSRSKKSTDSKKRSKNKSSNKNKRKDRKVEDEKGHKVRCSSRCETDFGLTGRVCDPTCSRPTSSSYGTRGCGASDLGKDCRACYYDEDAARVADSADSPVIMCATLAPPTAYGRRRLSAVLSELSELEWRSEHQARTRHIAVNPWDLQAESKGARTLVDAPDESHTVSVYDQQRNLGSSDRDGSRKRKSGKNGNKKSREGKKRRSSKSGGHSRKDKESRSQRRNSKSEKNDNGSSKRKNKRNQKSSKGKEKGGTSKSSGCESTCEANMGSTGRVCDPTCTRPTEISYGTRGCGTGDLGENCRACYNSLSVASEVDSSDGPVIMCNTLAPPTAYDHRKLIASNTHEHEAVTRRSRDDFVPKWRRSLSEKGRDGKHTRSHEDVRRRKSSTGKNKKNGKTGKSGRRNKNKKNSKVDRKSGKSGKNKQNKKNDTDPSKVRKCKRGCTGNFGDTGLVCDTACSSSSPVYGTRGCGAQDLGANCRLCYYNLDTAREKDTPSARVIMCETLAPPSAYDRRHLMYEHRDLDSFDSEDSFEDNSSEDSSEDSSEGEDSSEDSYEDSSEGEDSSEDSYEDSSEGEDSSEDSYEDSSEDGDAEGIVSPALEEFRKMSELTFGHGLVHGDLCAFMGSSALLLEETVVTVRSIREFMPGTRIAIAVKPKDFDVFDRTFANNPAVHIDTSPIPRLSAVMADEYCGDDTELIYYLQAGTLLSRSFTDKDTHSPRGDLLVVYSDGRGADYRTLASAEATSVLLGFQSPVFTFGTDLVLPADVNGQLRELIAFDAGIDEDDSNAILRAMRDINHLDAPEALAALAYSRNPEGIWFMNPQQWVAQHLFKTASIWDIPLVKPRFSCSIGPSVDLVKHDLSKELDRQLDALANGATCESGYMTISAGNTE